ncbi:MAG TPA: hypothetical protein VJZ27_00320 [Aggregatilineales bacterium]|nr:hypothetical protein [Aggregatilineales bacterium]
MSKKDYFRDRIQNTDDVGMAQGCQRFEFLSESNAQVYIVPRQYSR